MTLEKAELYSIDGEQYSFKFMYNPNNLSFNKKSNLTEDCGARTQQAGLPKTSFAHPNATVLKLANITIDAYERQGNQNLSPEIKKLNKAVKFVNGQQRPPIYIFRWGKMNYLKCYVESVDYQVTMFLEDGSPVRVEASITLKEVDPSQGSSNPSSSSSDRRDRDTRWNQPTPTLI